MKKILLLLIVSFFAATVLNAQDCNCGSVKFLIGQWKCQGKNAAGNPVYSGILNVGNGPSCIFKLLQIMQQTGGDVTLAPLTVPPNTVVNVPITFTDNPPYITAGSSPAFILVFTRGNTKCKQEIISAPIPACGDPVCQCNPNGWEPFVATIKNQQTTVKCGYQFSVACTDTFFLKGLYKCLGKCIAKYSAVLKNTATNTVVQNYGSFGFPWSYRFMTAGTYSLEISPQCGDAKCTPCRFFFTVTCKTACDCNADGWSKFEIAGAVNTQTAKCGDKIAVKKGAAVKINAKYTCKGDCRTKYEAVLRNNANGAIVQSFPAFTFPFAYNFPAGGVYRLEILAICGDKKCQVCTLYFSVQ